MMRYDISNHCLRHVNDTGVYIEIGTAAGDSAKHIVAKRRVGVDPLPNAACFSHLEQFHGIPSDEFWPTCKEKADVVFIDGLHEAPQAYRDILGALAVLSPRGVIVLHDCSPTTEAMQLVPRIQDEWTGDVWKAIVRVRAERPDLETFVVDTDYGVGVIVPGRDPTLGPLLKFPLPKAHPAELASWTDPDSLEWMGLLLHRTELLGLVSPSTWAMHFDLAMERRCA